MLFSDTHFFHQKAGIHINGYTFLYLIVKSKEIILNDGIEMIIFYLLRIYIFHVAKRKIMCSNDPIATEADQSFHKCQRSLFLIF